MKIEDGPIIPGDGIGNIKLNITKSQLLEIIKNARLKLVEEDIRNLDSPMEAEKRGGINLCH